MDQFFLEKMAATSGLQTSRNWVFTLNNPTAEDKPELWPHQYLIYQKEIGESGTPHLQGYIMFGKMMRLSAVKKLSGTAHWEVRRGTHDQARDYASKEATRAPGSEPIESGDPPKGAAKKNTDMVEIKKLIDEGKPLRYIADHHFGAYMRNYRAIVHYQGISREPRSYKTVVTVTYGPPGVGKSRRLYSLYPNAYWLSRGKWWPGYEGQEHVVIDEFYGWFKLDYLLRLLDRYPLKVETKGGNVEFTSRYLHFTSNVSPSLWYGEKAWGPNEIRKKAMFRRIEHIYRMAANGEIIVQKGSLDITPSVDLVASQPPPLSDD